MSKLSFNESRYKKILKGKGFYVALAVCIVAVAVAGFAAISNTYQKLIPDNGDTTSTPIIVEWPNQNADQADVTQSGIPKSSSQAVSSEPKESKPPQEPEKKLFMMPVGGEVIKPFSGDELVYSITMEDWRVHQGVDIAAEMGANVRSAANGKVLDVRYDDMWGTVVEIDHYDGLVAQYCGLGSNVPVKKGDTVEIGQSLGVVTEVPAEVAEQAHIHLVMLKDGKLIDPMTVLQDKDNSNSQ